MKAWTPEYSHLNENTFTRKVIYQLTTIKMLLQTKIKEHATRIIYSHVHKSAAEIAQTYTVGVWIDWGSSAPYVIILLGLQKNPGYVYGNAEAQESKPKHVSIFEAFVVIMFTKISLAKANHMAHLNISRTEKYTPSLARGTTRSPDKGLTPREGWRIGNNNAIFQM